MRGTHNLCGDAGDVTTTSLRGTWIDEAQRRLSPHGLGHQTEERLRTPYYELD
jgi:hypothetical protein